MAVNAPNRHCYTVGFSQLQDIYVLLSLSSQGYTDCFCLSHTKCPHDLTDTVLSVRHYLTRVECSYFHENVIFVPCGSQLCCRLTDIEVTFNSLTVLERTFNIKPS